MDANVVPSTVEEIFQDFHGRRSGLLRALTIDAEIIRQNCSPEANCMWLYGHPNGTWEASYPPMEFPPPFPEPVHGINFANTNGMDFGYWLCFVAAYSDSWLLSLAFFFATCARLTRNDRACLFDLINHLPTLFEIVTGPIVTIHILLPEEYPGTVRIELSLSTPRL